MCQPNSPEATVTDQERLPAGTPAPEAGEDDKDTEAGPSEDHEWCSRRVTAQQADDCRKACTYVSAPGHLNSGIHTNLSAPYLVTGGGCEYFLYCTIHLYSHYYVTSILYHVIRESKKFESEPAADVDK